MRLVSFEGSDWRATDVARRFGFGEEGNLAAVVTVLVLAVGLVWDVDGRLADGTNGVVDLRGGIGRWCQSEEGECGARYALGGARYACDGYHWHDEEHELGESVPNELTIHIFEPDVASHLTFEVVLLDAEYAMQERDVGPIPQEDEEIDSIQQLEQFLETVQAAQGGGFGVVGGSLAAKPSLEEGAEDEPSLHHVRQ